jgi:putative NADH-flavin reductase
VGGRASSSVALHLILSPPHRRLIICGGAVQFKIREVKRRVEEEEEEEEWKKKKRRRRRKRERRKRTTITVKEVEWEMRNEM